MKKVRLSDEQVLLKASPCPNTGCWFWTEGDNGRGYGRISRNNKGHQAHRIFYELFKGPIPKGAELDHTCRVKFCVNPEHLDPVDHRTNVQRGRAGEHLTLSQKAKTHCPRGHAYEGENVVLSKAGGRSCRECRRMADRARYPARYQRQKERASS